MLYKLQLQTHKHLLLLQPPALPSLSLGRKRELRAAVDPQCCCLCQHSIQIPNEERPDGSRLRALPCAAPRGKSIVKPCAKPAPKRCQESAESSHSLPINVDLELQGQQIPPDTAKTGSAFYTAVTTPFWSNPSLSPAG